MNKVIFITGASSGIGKACAEQLLKEGNIIFGTSRNINTSDVSYKENKINMLPLEEARKLINEH